MSANVDIVSTREGKGKIKTHITTHQLLTSFNFLIFTFLIKRICGLKCVNREERKKLLSSKKLLRSSYDVVRTKVRNREKHQGKHGKCPRKLGKQQVKHEITYGEMGENASLGEFLSHLVTSFQAASYIAGFTANDCQICLMNKSVYSGPFFPCFSPTHGNLCKIYLNDGWWRVQISCFCLVIS